MMLYFVEIACIVAEIWMIHMVMAGYFPKRDIPRWMQPAIYSIFGVIVTILSLMNNVVYIRLIFAIVGVWAISVSIFKARIIHGLLSSILFNAIYTATDIVAALALQLCGIDTMEIMADQYSRSVYLIVCHTIMFGFVLLIRLINRKSQEPMHIKILLPVVPCWLISVLLCYLLTWQNFEMDYQLHPLFLVVLLGLLYTSIVVIHYTNKINEQAQEKEKWEIAEHHYAMQQEYYDQLRVQQEETRAIWHDLSKYLRASQAETSADALVQVQQMVDSISCVVDVNNRVVSVILNEYYQIAKNSEIILKLDVLVPPELFITAADLYVLIGNSLDNAIEACMDLPVCQRTITLKLKTHNDILFYEVTNPYDEQHPPRLKSKYHGYGLKNVSRCVDRYSGKLYIKKENGIFTLTAHLNRK